MQITVFHHSKHLSADDVDDAREVCPVCGHGEPRHQVHRLQRDPDVFLLHCPKCHACSASHLPKARVLEQYYATYYQGDSKREHVTFHNPDRFGRHLSKWIDLSLDSSASTPIRICDIGGGDGALSVALARRFRHPCKIDVVDYPTLRYESTDMVQIRYLQDIERALDSYDIVIASAVIEHMTRLREIMPRILGLAAPGGYFYARTPYIVPFLKLWPNLDFTFPAHIHDLGPDFWSHALRLYGVSGDIVTSQPSIVETTVSHAFVRTLLSLSLKFPARLEQALGLCADRAPLWKFVGGWEVVFRMRPAS